MTAETSLNLCSKLRPERLNDPGYITDYVSRLHLRCILQTTDESDVCVCVCVCVCVLQHTTLQWECIIEKIKWKNCNSSVNTLGIQFSALQKFNLVDLMKAKKDLFFNVRMHSFNFKKSPSEPQNTVTTKGHHNCRVWFRSLLSQTIIDNHNHTVFKVNWCLHVEAVVSLVIIDVLHAVHWRVVVTNWYRSMDSLKCIQVWVCICTCSALCVWLVWCAWYIN